MTEESPKLEESKTGETSENIAKQGAAAPSTPVYATQKKTSDELKDEKGAFVNVGLIKWQESRKKWLARDDSGTSKAVATPLDVDEIIDIIFASPRQWREESGPQKFPQNVPLPMMIDILQDLWEAEGLDV